MRRPVLVFAVAADIHIDPVAAGEQGQMLNIADQLRRQLGIGRVARAPIIAIEDHYRISDQVVDSKIDDHIALRRRHMKCESCALAGP